MKISSGGRAGGNWGFVVVPCAFLVGSAVVFFVLPLVVSRGEK